MTDRLAIILGVLIVVMIGLDLMLNEGSVLLFLALKFAALVDWLVFWR